MHWNSSLYYSKWKSIKSVGTKLSFYGIPESQVRKKKKPICCHGDRWQMWIVYNQLSRFVASSIKKDKFNCLLLNYNNVCCHLCSPRRVCPLLWTLHDQRCLITAGSFLGSTLLHMMLNRPGTRSCRSGPDPDPSDRIKHGSALVRVPGRVSGPMVLVDLWRPVLYISCLLWIVYWEGHFTAEK